MQIKQIVISLVIIVWSLTKIYVLCTPITVLSLCKTTTPKV